MRYRKSPKILIAAVSIGVAYCLGPNMGLQGGVVMAINTCAACDYELDGNAIKVTIGGKTVDVCCEECAQKLRETHAATATAGKG